MGVVERRLAFRQVLFHAHLRRALRASIPRFAAYAEKEEIEQLQQKLFSRYRPDQDRCGLAPLPAQLNLSPEN